MGPSLLLKQSRARLHHKRRQSRVTSYPNACGTSRSRVLPALHEQQLPGLTAVSRPSVQLLGALHGITRLCFPSWGPVSSTGSSAVRGLFTPGPRGVRGRPAAPCGPVSAVRRLSAPHTTLPALRRERSFSLFPRTGGQGSGGERAPAEECPEESPAGCRRDLRRAGSSLRGVLSRASLVPWVSGQVPGRSRTTKGPSACPEEPASLLWRPQSLLAPADGVQLARGSRAPGTTETPRLVHTWDAACPWATVFPCRNAVAVSGHPSGSPCAQGTFCPLTSHQQRPPLSLKLLSPPPLPPGHGLQLASLTLPYPRALRPQTSRIDSWTPGLLARRGCPHAEQSTEPGPAHLTCKEGAVRQLDMSPSEGTVPRPLPVC